MSKHTPGPWEVRGDWYIHRVGAEGGSHAEVKSCEDVPPDRREEHKANARLMAAAPDMIELLLRLRQWDMLDVCHDGPCWKRLLDEVIAKATGEPAL